MISEILNRVIRFVPAIFSVIIAFASVFPASLERLDEDAALQVKRIAELEQAYSCGMIAPVDESSFFEGNLPAELESGIRFNEMSFIGTHNSYQTAPIEETRKLFQSLEALSFGLYSADRINFESETLTQQLNCGIRSFEIDIETFDRDGDISFTCMHSPYFEMTTSCYDFSLALKELAMWSENNPDHLPITVIIEPKAAFLPLKEMKFFNADYAFVLDEMLRETLGEKLFTPADMLRDYSSFAEMRAADDWCEVKDMLGKIVFLFHECGATEDYIDSDPSIKSLAMFPMLREKDIDRECASFILCNNPNKLIRIRDEVIGEKKIMVRTRVDSFGRINNEKCRNAFESGANIISTDYPLKTDSDTNDYVVTFEGRTTVRKNK